MRDINTLHAFLWLIFNLTLISLKKKKKYTNIQNTQHLQKNISRILQRCYLNRIYNRRICAIKQT